MAASSADSTVAPRAGLWAVEKVSWKVVRKAEYLVGKSVSMMVVH